MTKVLQVYKCMVCGNIVEVLYSGGGTLVCCNQPMKLMEENTVDAALEKHVPVVERIDDQVHVKVGSVTHPMTEEHYIQWIEVITEDKVYRKDLKPGDVPEAIFHIDGDIISVREYCNLHGLWKNK
ncbi:superoxide reductase [Clostridium amylolyticum]|uniref:Desulfoferrodoxin n=1 Tax=Clostridium amylolyticum TaxID=1121298 RepID=A0A1M6JJ76_9CLOT|nr:desulfoferrodoxin [Clostridium amylolyticum]SHJ46713.1 superoxide reductase [Clostridium amylolyticum]